MSRYRGSLIPRLFSRWWETAERPHRLVEPRLVTRLHPDHFLDTVVDDIRRFERLMLDNFHRPWSQFVLEHENTWSVIKNGNEKLQVTLDVEQYNPDEVKVKVIDDLVIVEGKHEQKENDNGTVTRHFVKKYLIPEQCDPKKITSTLSSDGVLTITAPLKPEAIEEMKERVINIEHTGKPAVEDEPEVKKATQK